MTVSTYQRRPPALLLARAPARGFLKVPEQEQEEVRGAGSGEQVALTGTDAGTVHVLFSFRAPAKCGHYTEEAERLPAAAVGRAAAVALDQHPDRHGRRGARGAHRVGGAHLQPVRSVAGAPRVPV